MFLIHSPIRSSKSWTAGPNCTSGQLRILAIDRDFLSEICWSGPWSRFRSRLEHALVHGTDFGTEFRTKYRTNKCSGTKILTTDRINPDQRSGRPCSKYYKLKLPPKELIMNPNAFYCIFSRTDLWFL